jgi:hypothetical protein
LISDRKDLEAQLYEKGLRSLVPNGHVAETVIRCSSGQDVEREVERLEADPKAKAILAVTLQSFPHINLELTDKLRKATAALADEAHRSHADKSLSESSAALCTSCSTPAPPATGACAFLESMSGRAMTKMASKFASPSTRSTGQSMTLVHGVRSPRRLSEHLSEHLPCQPCRHQSSGGGRRLLRFRWLHRHHFMCEVVMCWMSMLCTSVKAWLA